LPAPATRSPAWDVSHLQIDRARRLVPTAQFLHADITQVTFPTGTFDAVVSLYVLIHLPLEDQPVLFGRIATWLRPEGWLLATVTHREPWTGTKTAGRAARCRCGRATPMQRRIGPGYRQPACT
jgi:SAM-dependent methyltransferase